MSIRQKIQVAAMLTVLLTLVVLAARAQGPVATDTPTGATATPTPTGEPPTPWFLKTQTQMPCIVSVLLTLIAFVGGRLFGPAIEEWAKEFWQKVKWWGSEFDSRYIKHLIEEYQGLNIKGLRTRAPFAIDLERVYVSLRTRLPEMAIEIPERQELPLEIGEAMGRHKRLVILGGPGTGKTTLLAYLTLTYARGLSQVRLGLEENLLPIFVPLRQLRKVLAESGDEEERLYTLPIYLTAYYKGLGLQPPPDFFEKEMQSGRCLVLLDGLDEVADETERSLMSEWVDSQVTIYPNSRYVVTSRPPGYEKAPLANGFTTLYLCDFTERDISQFANNWCLAIETVAQGEENETARRKADEAAKDLVQAINKSEAIPHLAVNPLMLSIIALVHRYRAHLPERRVDLYGECVEVLLGYWDWAKPGFDRSRGLVAELRPGEKRTILQPIALALHKSERREIERRELEEIIGSLLLTVGGGQGDATDFLDKVRERSGLLVEKGINLYTFSHLTFQEYLAARELAENEKEQRVLLEKVGEEWWQEVTLLYAAMREATPIIDALLEGTDDPSRSRLLLAGRCVAEAIRVDPQARERVISELETLFETSEGELFLRSGRTLAEIARKDSVDFFLRLVAGSDPQKREGALWALRQMGRQAKKVLRDRVVERLFEHLNGEKMCHEAKAALKKIGGDKVEQELKRRLQSGLSVERAAATLAWIDAGLVVDIAETSDTVLRNALIAALDDNMIEIPAGKFVMGSRERITEQPVRKVYLDSFFIDKHPITNIQYKRFVDDTAHKAPSHWESGSYPSGRAAYPVTNVSWKDAAAYAEWVGKRLPTEAELEKAARGVDERIYPWGNDFDESKCNSARSQIHRTTRIGKYSPAGDSPYGVCGLAGNVWEWVNDWYDRSYYRNAPRSNPSGPDSGKHKVLRGGSWESHSTNVRCSARFDASPEEAKNKYGFRCASDAPDKSNDR